MSNRLETTEDLGSTGRSEQKPAGGDGASVQSNLRDLPSIIVDPALKVEAEALHHDKEKVVEFRTGRSSEPPPGAGKHGMDVNPVLSAAEADKFAESIRPSWEPPEARETKSEKQAETVKPKESASPTVAEAIKDDPELAVASAVLPFYKSKQNLLWAGGAGAALGLLAILYFSMGTNPNESRITVTEKAPKLGAAAAVAPSDAPKAPISAPAPIQQSDKAATVAATGSVAPAAVQAQPAAQPAAATRKVRIRVETSPPSAALSLDGTAVSNPFDVTTEPSGEHKIDARADGYSAISRTITFDKNQIVYLSLPRAKAEPAKAKAEPVRRPAVKRAATAQTSTRRAKPARPAAATRSRVSTSRSQGAGFVSSNPY